MRLLLTLLLIFMASSVYGAEYVHINDDQKILKDLPQSWNYVDGIHSNGNFRQLAKRKPALMLQQGFREITVDNSDSYDPETQNAGSFTVTVFADHAEKVRTITNKGLNAYKKQKGKEIIKEGRAILNAKYEYDWESGYDTDKATLKDYFLNTIRPLLLAAGTLQAVKDINNGDEYTWPSL